MTSSPQTASPPVRAGRLPHPATWLLGGLLLLGGTLAVSAGEEVAEAKARTLEYQVKAGFIYNFAKFVQWPTNTGPTNLFRIAVVADEKIFNVFSNELTGKILAGRRVEVIGGQTNDPAFRPEIMFVARTHSKNVRPVLETVAESPVLTVGESDDFIASGGCIQFIRAGENIRFQVNPAAAERARLKISSKLAALSTTAKTKEAAK